MQKIVKLRLLFLLAWLLSHVVLADTTAGKQLYRQHCSSCHGLDGKGGIGLGLNSAKLDSQLSDKYLIVTIKQGRQGRVMPAFKDKLNPDEIKSIVGYLRSWSGKAGPKYSDAKISGEYTSGKELYKLHCAGCHGNNLQGFAGGTGITKSRQREQAVAAPALSSPGFLAAAPDEMLRKIITQGRTQYSLMPAYAGKLKPEQINDIVYYIRKRGFMLSAQWHAEYQKSTQPIYKFYESPYSLEQTKRNLYNAIKGLNFRAYKPRLLEQNLVQKDDYYKANEAQTVFRFCNFKLLNEFIKIEPRLGVILPCNATVLKTKDGKVMVTIPNLERIIPMFNNVQLSDKTREMITILDDLVEEALL